MVQNPPEGYRTVTAQSITPDPSKTLAFVENVFGATVLDTYEQEGVIVHAEFDVGSSRMMVGASSEEFSPYPSAVHIYVDDVDATYATALEHGASSHREPADQFYGDRSAVVKDPEGNLWSIATHIEDVSNEEMQRRMSGSE